MGEQFQHRLVDHFSKQPPRLGMFCCGNPIGHDLFERLRGHAGMGAHDNFQDGVLTACKRALHVTLEQ